MFISKDNRYSFINNNIFTIELIDDINYIEIITKDLFNKFNISIQINPCDVTYDKENNLIVIRNITLPQPFIYLNEHEIITINSQLFNHIIDLIKKQEIKNQLIHFQEVYNNTDKEEIDDLTFDALQEYYNQDNNNKYYPIGNKTDEGDVELPDKMPSLNKIKGEKANDDLKKHYDKYGDDNIYEYKLDGVSILYCCDNGVINIYKRGDGNKGPLINHILEYIEFPKFNYNIHLRGEMIIRNSDLEEVSKYVKSKGKNGENSRSIVNGALTKVNIDPYLLSFCKPVFYEVKYSENEELNCMLPLDKLKYLYSLNINVVPYYHYVGRFNRESFDKYVNDVKKNELYRIDGIVVIPNIYMKEENINKNPDHIFAYKCDEVAVTKVISVIWNITSKDGYLNPLVKYEPIKLLGNTYSYFYGHNARFIVEKSLGEGAIISVRINGDIIPGYDKTIVPAKKVFAPNCEYEWDKNGVEIKILNQDKYPEIKCMKIEYFLKTIGVKNWGLKTIYKLYHSAGITNISKLICITKEQLMSADLIKDKSSDNLLNELQSKLKSENINLIMAGSGFFGEGISINLINEFIENFPNWRYVSPTYEEVLSRKNFGPVRSKLIIKGLEDFKNWVSQFPHLMSEYTPVVRNVLNNKLVGQIVNFSGFTDQNLVNMITSCGGIFKDNHVKSATIVVVEDVEKSKLKPSIKVKHALDNQNVLLISRLEFIKKLNL